MDPRQTSRVCAYVCTLSGAVERPIDQEPSSEKIFCWQVSCCYYYCNLLLHRNRKNQFLAGGGEGRLVTRLGADAGKLQMEKRTNEGRRRRWGAGGGKGHDDTTKGQAGAGAPEYLYYWSKPRPGPRAVPVAAPGHLAMEMKWTAGAGRPCTTQLDADWPVLVRRCMPASRR